MRGSFDQSDKKDLLTHSMLRMLSVREDHQEEHGTKRFKDTLNNAAN